MHKTRLLLAAFAAMLIAAPASLSATEPAAGHVNTQSAEWREHWEPCFKERPADRIAALRGVGAWNELLVEVLTGDVAGTNAGLHEEMAAFRDGARINRIFEDLKSVANNGCAAAQNMTAIIYGLIYIRRGVEGPEWLKWMMLAEKSGSLTAQVFLKENIWKYSVEEVATARAWVDAWRPSD